MRKVKTGKSYWKLQHSPTECAYKCYPLGKDFREEAGLWTFGFRE